MGGVQRALRAKPPSHSLQIQVLHAEGGHGLLVEHQSGSGAARFGNPVWPGLAVARPQAQVNTLLRPLFAEVMRAGATGEHFHHQHGGVAHAHQLHIGQQARGNRVGNQVADALFLGQWVSHAHHLARIVHTDDQATPSRVGKGHQRLEHVQGRGQVALELKLLAFRLHKKGGGR